jgi:integrase
MVNLDIEYKNSRVAEIEGFYRLSIDIANKLNNEEKNNLISFAKNKKKFNKDINVGIMESRPFFSNILLFSELKKQKDLVNYSFEEIIDMIKELSNNDVFTSKSLYQSCLNIIYHYTRWGYNNHFRNDIIRTEDITNVIKFEELIEKSILGAKILTVNEMIMFSQLCDYETVELALLCAMEGLSIKEIVNLKIVDFEDENHKILLVTNRNITLSNSLYDKLRNLSKKISAIAHSGFGDTERMYAKTDYVIRQFHSVRITNKPYNEQNFTTQITKQLNQAGFCGGFNDFRLSMKLNDYLDGLSLASLNRKYNIKLHHIDYYKSKYKTQVEVLRGKRASEV